jgi:hypothetical protein
VKIDSTLRQLPGGQWAIQAPGREPVEIPAGEIFLIEVPGFTGLEGTRMEQARPSGEYYSVDGHQLRDGMRAGFFDQRERYAKLLSPHV